MPSSALPVFPLRPLQHSMTIFSKQSHCGQVKNLDYSKDEDGSYDNRMDIDYGEDYKSIHLDFDDDSDDVYIPKKHKKMEDD